MTSAAAKVLLDKYNELSKRDYPPPTLLLELAATIAALPPSQDELRYRMARTMPLVLDYGRITPLRPDKFDALIDAAIQRGEGDKNG